MRLIILGEPVPKKRPRVLKNGHVYTPRETVEYESAVAWACKGQRERFKDSPLELYVWFHCTPRPRQKVGDLDNLIKSVMDGIGASGVIANDRNVVSIHAHRLETQLEPRTELILEYLPA